MPVQTSESTPLDSAQTECKDAERLTKPQRQFADVLGEQFARRWTHKRPTRKPEAKPTPGI